jgi:hypothetical protein
MSMLGIKSKSRQEVDTLDQIEADFTQDRGLVAAIQHVADTEAHAMIVNAKRTSGLNVTTESDREQDVLIAKARFDRDQARRRAGERVKPRLEALHTAAARRLETALVELLEARRDVEQAEAAAARCAVSLPRLTRGLLSGDDADRDVTLAEYRHRLAAAGIL